ncbi:hypothetical protein K438DRAFT_1970131 [Mycena galopus ATCC 62051]|nr:hypothetical protein K438DRAFT_1970131 [Mycena galopus ATCC 62051]
MTNFIQLVPSSTPATQYFVHGATNPLFIPTATQRTSFPPSTQVTPTSTQATATQAIAPTSMVHGNLGEGMFFQRPSAGGNPATSEVPCADIAPLDSQLPRRPTCAMPYHPDIGISRVEHSENAGCKFYVACPACIQGTYNTSQRADKQVKGYRNGRAIAVHTWAEAQDEWATVCLRWHGSMCPNARSPVTVNTRVQLNPALRKRAPAEQWVVKGVPGFSSSRELAFTATAEKDLREIHILGSTDEARLIAWAN